MYTKKQKISDLKINAWIIPGLLNKPRLNTMGNPGYLLPTRERLYKMAIIRRIICKYFCIPIKDLKQRKKTKELSMARQLIVYQVAMRIGLNPNIIMKSVNLDRTCYYHCIKIVENDLVIFDYRKKVAEIEKRIDKKLLYV